MRSDLALLPQLKSKMRVSPQNINDSEADIAALAFSPDGKWLAAGSLGAVLTIWDAQTWTEKRIYPGSVGGMVPAIRSLAFSPNSQVLAVGFDGGGLVWDVKNNREISRFESGQIFSLAFSPDGTQLASTSGDKVRISNLQMDTAPYTIAGGDSVVRFSPDGRLGAAAGSDSTVVWDVQTGQVLTTKKQTFKNPDAQLLGMQITSLAFSPDGQKIATGEGARGTWTFPRSPLSGEVLIWETATGKDIAEIRVPEETMGLQFSPNGKWLVGGNADGNIYVWDATTGVQINAFPTGSNVVDAMFLNDSQRIAYINAFGAAGVTDTQTGNIVARMTTEVNNRLTSIAASASSGLVAVGDRDGNIWVWKLFGQEATQVDVGPGVSISSVAFSPDGKKILIGAWDRTVRIADALTGEVTSPISHTQRVLAARFSPDGKTIASGTQDGQIKVLDVQSGQEIFRATVGASLGDLVFSPDGTLLAASEGSFPRDAWFIYKRDPGDNPTEVVVWDSHTGQERFRLPHPSHVNSLSFSPDGKRIAAAGDDNQVHIWDVNTHAEILQVPHQNRVNLVSFSPDGKRGASAESCFPTGQTYPAPCSPFVQVWDAVSGKELWRTELAAPWVSDLLFSPDGKWLATTNEWVQGCPTTNCEFAAQVWDADSGQLVSKMVHGDALIALAFSPDARRIVSGGSDGILRIWDPVSGSEISHITGIGSPWSAAFSPDGRSIVVGGYEAGESYARVLPVQAEALVQSACQRVVRNLTAAEWRQYLGDEPIQATCPNVGIVKDTGRLDGPSSAPRFSADGKYLVFQSTAKNLTCALTTQHSQIYLYDREAKRIDLLSASPDGQGADADATYDRLSPDGRFVLFDSRASNLTSQRFSATETSLHSQLYLYDRSTKRIELVSTSPDGRPANADAWFPSVSADWHFIVFQSSASNLVPGAGAAEGKQAQVYLYDRETKRVELISARPDGKPTGGESTDPQISPDGRYIAFQSTSSEFIPGSDVSTEPNVYLDDRTTRKHVLVTRNREGKPVGGARVQGISANGQEVIFSTGAAALDAASTSPSGFYRYDIGAGQINPAVRFDQVWSADWDPDSATQDFYGTTQVFYRDPGTGVKTMISTGVDGEPGNDMSQDAVMTDDGRFISFTSLASNLVAGDTNAYADVFLWDRTTGKIERISMGSNGQEGNGHSYQPTLSSDGRYVAFASNAKNLIALDQSEYRELFIWDRSGGQISRITEATRCQIQGR